MRNTNVLMIRTFYVFKRNPSTGFIVKISAALTKGELESLTGRRNLKTFKRMFKK
jgi:hypothetical protein